MNGKWNWRAAVKDFTNIRVSKSAENYWLAEEHLVFKKESVPMLLVGYLRYRL